MRREPGPGHPPGLGVLCRDYLAYRAREAGSHGGVCPKYTPGLRGAPPGRKEQFRKLATPRRAPARAAILMARDNSVNAIRASQRVHLPRKGRETVASSWQLCDLETTITRCGSGYSSRSAAQVRAASGAASLIFPGNRVGTSKRLRTRTRGFFEFEFVSNPSGR
jgi:hypothetical protein